MANLLREMVEAVFVGLIDPFLSSDPSPGGGINPGDEWYTAIHTELQRAQSVWVLATPRSIGRPWIYWEAGVGKALCPTGVVVIRVGIEDAEVPSPLSAYQSYDGLVAASVAELLAKIGHGAGMRVPAEWSRQCAETFVKAANDLPPPPAESASIASGEPKVSPEHVSRLEAAIARMEAVIATSEAQRLNEAPSQRLNEAPSRRRRYVDPESVNDNELFGRHVPMRVNGVEVFYDLVHSAPAATVFQVHPLDVEGDVPVVAKNGRFERQLWLFGRALPMLPRVTSDHPRWVRFVKDVGRMVRRRERADAADE